MQRTLSPKAETWGSRGSSTVGEQSLSAVVKENPVVVVGRMGCCMVHVLKRLLTVHGVNPTVYEVRDDADEISLTDNIESKNENKAALPVVFIGGNLMGGLERIMGVHISGELVTKLRDAGAIWL